MEQVELGEFEKRVKLGGEHILGFRNWFFFQLHHGIYYRAGRVHGWSGDPKGVGLNYHIVKNIPIEDLVIENVATGNCYIADDLDELKNNYGEEVQKGKKLIILPLFAFGEVEIKDRANIPEKLKT